MTDKTAFPFWNTDWFDSPKNYSDILDIWWNSVSASVPEVTQNSYQKMMNQGKTFYFLGEQFSQLLQGISGINQATDDWQKYLNEQFESIKKIYSDSHGGMNETVQGMFGAWQLLPMDTFHRTFSSTSLMPGDFLQDFKTNNFHEVTDKFLSVPGIGYTRESQEQVQEGIRLWNDYQRTANEYIHAISKVGLDALEAMRLRILEMAEKGEVINSLRGIYDLWVDSNEKAYAAYVYTDEYSEIYGRMTNALMAVKKHSRNTVDEMLASLNMPTRKTINTMLERQQELRREHISAIQKIKQLEKEQQELRKMFADSSIVKKTKEKRKKKTNITTSKTKTKKVTEKKTSQKKTIKKTTKKTVSNKNKKASGKNRNNDNMIIIKI